jgi:adenylyltransferase/sulfurtransferase
LKYVGYKEHLTPLNASSSVSRYDLVLDCTDHPTSRYLISDICILLSKPLISASALRTDGQLIVLNSPPLPQGNAEGGPCYRCVFPKPPPAESVVSCGDGGILGPVVGVMGVLQAGEALKMIASGKLVAPNPALDPYPSTEILVPNGTEGIKRHITPVPEASMLLFSSLSTPPFRTLRLRSRRPNCFACSSTACLTLESLSSGSLDYVLFCGLTSPVKILLDSERISALEYEKLRKGKKHVLLDVREKVQFDICSLPGAINIPFSAIHGNRPVEEKPAWLPEDLPPDAPIYVVCRLGNDSQVIAKRIQESLLGNDENGHKEGKRWIGDIKGGLRAWREEVDRSWPEY